MTAERKDSAVRPRRLCPTELKILAFVERHQGKQFTKEQIATALGKSEKTIDRQMHRLRLEGYVISESQWDDSGRQLANAYRLTVRKW